MSDIVKVPFYDDSFDCIKDESDVYVGIASVCARLGLDASKQIQRIKRQSWGSQRWRHMAVPSAGGQQLTFVIHLEILPMWLATITVTKVRADLRDLVALYQTEAAKVLFDYFTGTRESQTVAPSIADNSVEKARLVNEFLGQMPWVTAEMKAPFLADCVAMLTGRPTTMLLPVLGAGIWRSPSEMATENGVTANAVGLMITKLGFRGGDHCKPIMNKALHSDRNVVSYLYDEVVQQAVREAFALEAAS